MKRLLLSLLIVLCSLAAARDTPILLRTENYNLSNMDHNQLALKLSKIIKVDLFDSDKISHDSFQPNELFLTFKIISGQASAFLALQSQVSQINQQQNENSNEQWQLAPLKLQEGLNTIDVKATQELLGVLESSQAFILVILPNEQQSQVIVKLSEPRHAIEVIEVEKVVKVQLTGIQVHGKIFNVPSSDDYSIQFKRASGSPQIKIISCWNQDQIDCIYSPLHLPRVEGAQPIGKTMFKERMIGQEEQFSGKKCDKCNVYVLVQSYEGSISMEMLVRKLDAAIELKENEVKREYLSAGASKKYSIWIKENEVGYASLKIYEGEVRSRLEDTTTGYEFTPNQFEGLIPIEIPKGNSQESVGIRQVYLYVASPDKDSSYSILYSSGEYEVYLRDGQTISQQIKADQKISFYYVNEKTQEESIYLSLSIDSPLALKKLGMQVFQYEMSEGVDVWSEYIPSKPLFDLEGAKSMVLQIPGKYPKLLFTFVNSWGSRVTLDMTINDEEIIYLPLYHNLPLQVEKGGRISLLIKNNQEGFIELTIKKCDDSDPSIAYSLDSSDFLNEVYDYESIEETERITINSIKVKKGKGLYVRVTGDSISNSFIEVSARYMELDRKKVQLNRLNRGGHGAINYQLITDSKAEITFTGLECAEECRDSTIYECIWSTSRADLYRKMICPSSYLIGSLNQDAHTGSYNIGIRPARSDNQVSFKHEMSDNILFLSVKATHPISNKEFFYKDIEIVTIQGQFSRLSDAFKKKIAVGFLVVVVGLYLWISSRNRRGYRRLKTQVPVVKAAMKRMESEEEMRAS